MTSVTEWVLMNRDKIEKGVEIMGQAAEVLAATVGQLHPILEAVFVASSEILKNPDSKEARYLTQQFDQVNKKLEDIKGDIDNIALELQKTSMNKQNFDREAQMISQYEKYQEFLNAKTKFKEKKMEKFLTQYENTDADMNLDALYYAVTGQNTSGDPMLETVVTTEQRSRRAVEEFCARLKKLFVMGIIAIMGYAALKEGYVKDDMVKKWQDRMEDVEKRMKTAVEYCTNNFAKHAEEDMEKLVKNTPASVDSDFTKSLLESLVKKYDWVKWSIRVFNNKERIFFFNWLAGKKYYGRGGSSTNYFEIQTDNRIQIVVSFCVDPKPIDKKKIQVLIENENPKGNMMNVALGFKKLLPNCLVHAISHYKEVVETNNFHDDCYYYGKHRRAYLCIHSE